MPLTVNSFLRLSIPAILLASSGYSQVVIPGMLPTSSNYTLTSPPRWLLDGASGPIVARSKSTGGGPAPKAVTSNLPWKSALDAATTILGTGYNLIGYQGAAAGQVALLFATVCFGDNSQTASCTAAKDMLDHMEQWVPFGFCVDSVTKCGVGDFGITSYGGYWAGDWSGAYGLMRDQMTTTEQHNFTAKMINDLSAWGGTNSSSSTSCTNATTDTMATANSGGTTTVTASAAVFGSGHLVQIGDWLNDADPGFPNNPVKVVSITSPTVAVVSVATNFTGLELYTWSGTFTVATSCGWIWAAKHDTSYPYALTNVGGSSSGGSMYPGTLPSGQNGGDGTTAPPLIFGSSNLQYIDEWAYMTIINVCLDDDVNQASRSIPEFAAGYNYWYQSIYQWGLNQWTGFNSSGNGYGIQRASYQVAGVAFMIQNQTSSPGSIPLMSGPWNNTYLASMYMSALPGEQDTQVQWGVLYASGQNIGISNMQFVLDLRAYSGSSQAAYFNWWLRNQLPCHAAFGNTCSTGTGLFWTEANINSSVPGNSPSANSSLLQPWLYLFTDPLDTATPISGAPLQFAFNQTNTTGASSCPISEYVSRTSLTSANATAVMAYANCLVDDLNPDHFWEGSGHPSSYKIIKNNYLLTEDNFETNGSTVIPASFMLDATNENFSGGGAFSNYVMIGGSTPQEIDPNLDFFTNGQKIFMPRALSTNNAFGYTMIDATAAYINVSPTHVYRHLSHLKGGAQDFVVVYDDVALSSPTTINTFLHYPNNGSTDGSYTRGSTSISGSTITSNYAGTAGNSDQQQLLTKILSPGTITITNAGTSCSYCAGNANVFTVSGGASLGASVSSAEFMVVHEPVSGTGNTMPTTALIGTIDGNHTGVEIDGGSPAAAIFGRFGTDYTSGSFTLGFPSTGQIAIASVVPTATSGFTYKVMNGGTTVATGINVGTDGTIVVNSGSGNFTFGSSGSVSTPSGVVLGGNTLSGGSVLH